MHGRRGAAIVEFTLVAIPLLFLICFTFEFGRAIWSFHTLAGAAKSGARYVIVHGDRCADADSACQVSVGDVALKIKTASFGLDPAQLNITLRASDATRNCAPVTACLSDTDAWPPNGNNAVGLPISVDANYSFQSAVRSLWPGQPVDLITLVSSSHEVIQF